MAVLTRLTFLVILLSALASARFLTNKPQYLECVDSNDCSGYQCCVFESRGWYSMPKCLALHGVGESCDPSNDGTSQNITKQYPVGVVNFTNIFFDFCACERGLVCDGTTNTCQDPLTRDDYNGIDVQYVLED